MVVIGSFLEGPIGSFLEGPIAQVIIVSNIILTLSCRLFLGRPIGSDTGLSCLKRKRGGF